MKASRYVALILLGMALGIGLTIGSYYGMKEYAPDLAVWYLKRLGGPDKSVADTLGLEIDPSEVRSIVGDILSSDQGKAIVTDLMKGPSREMFEDLLRQAADSPEFRKMLSEVLESFLLSPEGKELLKNIAKEILSP
ncbi:MAG: hypothetical protein ACOX4B_03445 [Bacillota bacterium]|nr:hypothetical protein [Candidatus Fermentithermobacillaceae bacterium]